MGKFITTDRNQGFLLPPSIEEWVAEDHLARFIVDIVDNLDLSEITKHYQRRGSEAHHPSTLLSLLIYGYATGVYSSRKIEQATHDSLVFRYIAGNTHPDHTSLANFRKNHRCKFESIFVQVLTIATEMKLLKLGNIAIDGSKVKANASKHKALSYGHILKLETQLKAEVATLIKNAEEADNTSNPKIDIPAELSRREDRLTEIAAAKARIEERAKIRDEEAQKEYEAKLAKRENQAKAGKKHLGRKPKEPDKGVRDNEQVSLTDEESRIMKMSGGGFIQAYNAQAAVDIETMLIVSTGVTQDCNDKKQVLPMLNKLNNLPDELGQVDHLLADTGYFSSTNVEHCINQQITPLIAMNREQHNLSLDKRFAEDDPEPQTESKIEKLAWLLKTKAARALYATRKSTVEPVFGIIKNVMKFRQFSLRGLEKVTGEWVLVSIAWNLKRLNVLRAT
jgi:transposase/IS5 family transposase